VGSRPTEAELIRIFLDRGIRDFVSVPCSVTDTWHDLAAREAQAGRLDLVMTSHEGNLAGIAGGVWLGTGRPALVHMQNSGLTNAADGFISFADPTVFGIPLLALVTYRGATPEDRSEPHQAIGRRTESLVDSVFGPSATIAGERSGRALRSAAERAADAARDGGVGVVKIAEAGLAKVEQAQLRDPVTSPNVPARSALRMFKGAGSCPSELTDDAACASQRSRDDAIRTIAARHPDAALLFSNGFTSRAARATVDHARCFYNIGYMGGTLAIGWGLARSRPDLEVVVVDGDQNALMSGMKDQLAAEYPPNLHWYILDNGIGASVGTSESIPLAPWFGDLARIVRTRPDPPGSFSHPRVAAPRPGEALRSLAERFRNHLSV
jgi:phosphonopyruvate decarboxylase